MTVRRTKEQVKIEIYELECAIPYLQSVIAHLEGQGVEIYNNRTPCVFEATEQRQQRRQHEAHSPEIYEKSGEEILGDLKETLQKRQSKIADLINELATIEQ